MEGLGGVQPQGQQEQQAQQQVPLGVGLAGSGQGTEPLEEAHVRLGTMVAKHFRDTKGKYCLFYGRVVGFTPKSADGPALYRVRYEGDAEEDDDDEDLSEAQLQAGLRAWA